LKRRIRAQRASAKGTGSGVEKPHRGLGVASFQFGEGECGDAREVAGIFGAVLLQEIERGGFPEEKGGLEAQAGLGGLAFLQILHGTANEGVGLAVEKFSIAPISCVAGPAEEQEGEKDEEKPPAVDRAAEADFSAEFSDLGGGH
jgi:hypothetical protein